MKLLTQGPPRNGQDELSPEWAGELDGERVVRHEWSKQRETLLGLREEVLPNSAFEPSTTRQKGVQAAREEGDLIYKRILVPIDFSEHSRKTVAYDSIWTARAEL